MGNRVGVIIVNYLSYSHANSCISSIKKNCHDEIIFIVIDNSPAPEISLITDAHPDIIPIIPGHNTGFAGGCNLGIARALEYGLNYVLLLNPDTRAENDIVAILREELEKDEQRALAGPKIVRDNSRRDIWFAGAKMNWWLKGTVHVLKDHTPAHDVACSVPFLSGCAMMIRSSVLRTVGPIPEDYFLYFEDADYSQRVLNSGFTIIYVPAAMLIHHVSSTVGAQSYDHVYYISRNRIWFMQRWAKRHHYLVFMAYNILVKVPGSLIVFGLLARKPELVKAYIRGLWHGIVRRRETVGVDDHARTLDDGE